MNLLLVITITLGILGESTLGGLPGMSPRSYDVGEGVELKVNKLTSMKTQLPYDFYDALPFCQPNEIIDKKESIGEIIRGDRISNSLYKIRFLESQECTVLGENVPSESIRPWKTSTNTLISSCTRDYTARELSLFAAFIKNEYHIHWELDGMPSIRIFPSTISETKNTVDNIETKNTVENTVEKKLEIENNAAVEQPNYEIGFPLGFRDTDGNIYLNNHVSITILYHNETLTSSKRLKSQTTQNKNTNDQKTVNTVKPNTFSRYRVIGFEVEPMSIDFSNNAKCGDSSNPLMIYKKDVGVLESGLRIQWTYSVKWKPTETRYKERWDRYLSRSDRQIHWFSVVNSVMVVLFLSGMIAVIFIRTLHSDLRKYTQQVESQEDTEETGWKLVHGDVFRAPECPLLLSTLAGSGAQMWGASLATLLVATFGAFTPASGGVGNALTSLIICTFLSSVIAGFVSARFSRVLHGSKSRPRTAMAAAFLVPGAVFTIFIVLSIFLSAVGSSGGATFSTILIIMALWAGLALPLAFVGAAVAMRGRIAPPPVRVNPIPRQVPPQPWYMSTIVTVIMGGSLPFGSVFIEIFFVLGALWGQQLYYLFGFLFVILVVLGITCAEVGVVMTYFQLCAEDYNWWWKSFFTSGSSAFYFFLYSVFYFATKLRITKFVSILLYFGYTLIFSILFFVMAGFVGLISSYFFVRKIYSSLKFN